MHEIETPVSTPEIETLATAPEAPFASAHLKAQLSAAETTEAVEAPNLPATLSAALARLREINALAPTDAKGLRAKTSQLATLAAHVHRLSQGPTAPRIDHKAFFKRHVPASALAFVEASYPKTKARKA